MSNQSGGESPRAIRKSWTRDAAVRQSAMREFARLDLSSARSAEDLISRTAAFTGKTISVHQVSDLSSETAALCVEGESRAFIYLRADAEPFYQARCLFHEIGHLIFRHPGCQITMPRAAEEQFGGEPTIIRGLVLSALYSDDPHEREAEMLAALIGRQLLRPRVERDQEVFG